MIFPGPRRLSWQLWASHLAVIAITLVALVGALVLLVGAWMLRQGVLVREPAADAQVVAVAVGSLVRRGASAERVGELLEDLQAGGVQVQGRPFGGQHWGGPPPAFRMDLQDVEFVVVVGADGRVLGSSAAGRYPPGQPFAPGQEVGWREVLPRALAGEMDAWRLSSRGSGGMAVGAYPILGTAGGRPIAAVALAKRAGPPPSPVGVVARGLAAFGIGSFVVLTVSSVFALTFSGLAAYALSRRLGRRVDDLSRAADTMAAGDLSRRVAAGEPDELGRLAERFNAMAERLEASIAALEVEKARAEESLRTKRELMANVSHELRTPLTLIRGHIESLALAERDGGTEGRRDGETEGWGGGGAERVHSLRIVEAEIDQLSRLIEDLFALATAEGGGLPLAVGRVELAGVVAEAVEAVREVARRERQVTVINRVGNELPPVVADRQRVGQVLTNLLRNALRYTPEGGLVSVSAEGRDGEVMVSVADTGLGIPPEALPLVFERFYRADAARDRESGGAGLGLAIVRELVEAMGGRVGAESVEGEGSRFWFTLPVDGGRKAEGAGRPETVLPPPAALRLPP